MRAPEAPSGWPIAIAPPRTLTRSGSSSGQPREAGERLRGERLVELDDVDVVPADAGARERLVGRLDRRDPEDVGVDAVRAPSRRRAPAARGRAAAPARSSPISSMLAPSLSGEELPAVTVPPSTNAGVSSASFSSEVSARMPSSRVELDAGHRHDLAQHALVVGLARRAGGCAARTRPAPRARSPWIVGELLGALAERDRPLLGHLRVDHPPAERRRVQRLVAGRDRPARA